MTRRPSSHNRSRYRQRLPHGSVLIEALIALLIISFGTIAVVSMQTTAIRSVSSSSKRTIATNLAYEMAARIYIDPNNASSYDMGTTAASKLASSYVAPASNCGSSLATRCASAADAKTRMLYDWASRLNAALPNAKVIICRTTAIRTGTSTSPGCNGNGGIVVKIWYYDYDLNLQTIPTTEPNTLASMAATLL